MERHQQIRELFSTLGSTIVSVEFMKRDGTLRKIQFNPRDRQEIVGTGRPSNNPNIFRVRDFAIAKRDGVGAWRSFDANRVRSISYRGQVLNWTA